MLEPIDDARHIGGTVSIAIVAVAAHEVYHDAESAELVRLRHTSLATEAQEFPPLLHVQLASHAAPATFEKELAPLAVDFSAAVAYAPAVYDCLGDLLLIGHGGARLGVEMFRSPPVQEAL